MFEEEFSEEIAEELPEADAEETKPKRTRKSSKDPMEMKIEDLPGVGEKISEKLIEMGYTDLMSLAVTPAAQLEEDTGVGEATAQKIINEARSALKMNFVSGNELLQRRQEVGYISTGSKELDNLLGGKGIETQAITEFFGQFGSGKSQTGFQLAVNVQLPKEKGGLNGHCIFIDTERTFRPERIKQIATGAELNPDEVLSKIKVAVAYSSDHQILLAEKIPELIESEKIPVKLIVIDSLMGLFRAEYIGRGTLAERQQKLNNHLHYLQRLADRYNLAVYVCNQVMSKPDIFFGDPTQAIGGHIVGHVSTYRVYLRKSKGDKRVARMIDSPCLPEGEAVFRVTPEGVRD